MKKLMSIFGAALFVFSLSSCGGDDAAETKTTETEHNDDVNKTPEYLSYVQPDSWETTNLRYATIDIPTNFIDDSYMRDTDYSFTLPDPEDENGIYMNMYIHSDDYSYLENEGTLTEYTLININLLKTTFEESTNFNDRRGYNEETKMKWACISYNPPSEEGSKELQRIAYLFFENNTGYVIGFVCTTDRYKDLKPTIEKIIKSFKLK